MRCTRQQRQSGVTSIEIVLMLPVFILLLFGVYHLQGVVQNELATRQAARACAWDFALRGCVPAADHGLCTEARPVRGQGGHDGSLERDGDVRAARAESGRRGVFETLERIPVVRELTQFLFGEGASAHARSTVPGVLRDEASSADAATYLVCNTLSESWRKKVEDSLCSMGSSVGLDLEILGC